MSSQKVVYSVETELPNNVFEKLIDYIQHEYVMTPERHITGVTRAVINGVPTITFDLPTQASPRALTVEVKAKKPIDITVTPNDPSVTPQLVNQTKQDMVLLAELFEDKVRAGTLYFAWREGERIVPEKVSTRGERSLNRIFLETQVLLFVSFILISFVLLLITGNYLIVPVVILAAQLVFVFFSDRVIARTADWRITSENPYIHLLEYHLPLDQIDEFRKKLTPQQIVEMKKEIYEKTIAKDGELDCQALSGTFDKFSIACNTENLTTRKVNVYELVKKTADKFHFPTPKIVVSNTLLPNAAASGPSPSRGIVLITTGLLADLEEPEIISVLGHEFGHLKGRDSLALYALSSIQYLFTFFVAFAIFPWIFNSLYFIVYFWLVATVTYFIAKFFEARADLISAEVIGQPKVLAESLERVGFKRLLYERVPQYRFQEWISLEPHPPIYFRVARLESLKEPVRIRYPLLRSAKDVIAGFFHSF